MPNRVHALLAACVLTVAPAAAQQPAPKLVAVTAPAGKYELDKTHASLVFRVRHLGISNYTARFTRFDSTVDYDAADPTRSRLTVSVDPTSVETDFPLPEKEDFDRKIAMDEGFLEAGKFPEIRFVSTAVRRTGDNRGEVTGNLTFHGVTRPITLATVYNGAIAHPITKKPRFGISARGMLSRSAHGVSAAAGFVGDEVELVIEAEYEAR